MAGIWVVVLSSSFFTHSAFEKNMAIGGVVITVRPDDRRDLEIALARFSELSVYGSDEKGNIIATINGDDSGSIKSVIRTIEEIDAVRKVNLAYLNTENVPDTPAGTAEQR